MAEWAKLHTDILADPKLMRAARKGAKWLLYLPWLIAFAKRADDGGRLTVNGEPAEAEDYLQSIPSSTEKGVAAALEELEKLQILTRKVEGASEKTGQILRFVAWSKRQQAPSESNEAVRQRVKKHRESRKSKKINEAVTDSNEGQTLHGNVVEGEGDIEGEGALPVTRAVTGATGNAAEPDDSPYRAAPFIDAWREIRQGIPNGGLIGRTCKPVAAEVGQAEALHRWNRFLAERRHSPPAYFAQEHGQYAGLALINGRPPPASEPEPNWIEPPTDPDEIARLKADGFR